MANSIFSSYRATIEFSGKCLGGTPADPGMVEKWIASSAGISGEDQRRELVLRTLTEIGFEFDPESPYDAIMAAAKASAVLEGNRFKFDETGLYIEDRQVKALIKEAVNILFAGQQWGATLKGPRSYVAERVFVHPARIRFFHIGSPETCLQEKDGVERLVGHIMGPQGPRSILQNAEYVEGAGLSCVIKVLNPETKTIRRKPSDTDDTFASRSITHPTDDEWAAIWELGGEGGLGASRSQSYGKFQITGWEKVQ